MTAAPIAPKTFLDGRVTLHEGDCLAVLAAMEPDSVDCVVTSPPYWGLRDYGVDGQIGLEPTLGEHLEVMVAVFDAVRRVLKPTGTLWLNYGDTYATSPNGRSAAATKAAGNDDRTFRDKPFGTAGAIYKPGYEKTARVGTGGNRGNTGAAHGGRIVGEGPVLKPKDLCMVPNRLAIALQEAGWWVRSEIVWGKPNPMPDSSGRYRPSTAHEKLFLLTRSGDADVWVARDTGEISFAPDLAERALAITDPAKLVNRWICTGHYYDAGAVRQRMQPSSVQRLSQNIEEQAGSTRANGGAKTNGTMKAVGGKRAEQQENGRLLRNYEPVCPPVWDIATRAYTDAHFATMPPELAARCILAGCPKGGLVLDPFGGAGTTALAALRHGRRAALIELNPDYAAQARRRIEREWRVEQATPIPDAGPLFAGEAAE